VSTARVYNYQVKNAPPLREAKVSTKFLERTKTSQQKDRITAVVVNALIISFALFVACQFVRGTFLNVDRYITLNSKMANLEALNLQAIHQNAVLKKKYKNYNSPAGLEGLARDYLNLVGENEISIILKKS